MSKICRTFAADLKKNVAEYGQLITENLRNYEKV